MKTVRTNNPPVTIVVCVYNAVTYLSRALDSLLNQSYDNLSLLIIDDGSSDGSLHLINEYTKKYPKITSISDGVNLGTAARRQQGLDAVESELMSFFDADDIAEKTLIDDQVSKIETDEKCIAVGVYAHYIGADNDNKFLGTQAIGVTSKDQFYQRYENNKLIYMTSFTLFKKQYALSVGGFRQLGFNEFAPLRVQDISEDVDLWTRMSDFGKDGYYMITIPVPLVRYRKMGGTLSEKNIFLMSKKLRWIKDCCQRRRTGNNELIFSNYLKQLTLVEKIILYFGDYGGFFYKKMTLLVLDRRFFFALAYGVLAVILNPLLIYKKAKMFLARFF